MDDQSWATYFRRLEDHLILLESWTPEPPAPEAQRCEQSKHRTLGHLRACQEQWLIAAEAFLEYESPSITLLHPWRQFEVHGYAFTVWAEHMEKFRSDRERWMTLSKADWNRDGKWNRKPDTISRLVWRLVSHEEYHLALFEGTMRAIIPHGAEGQVDG